MDLVIRVDGDFEGEWYRYSESDDKPVELLIHPISVHAMEQIRFRIFGRKATQRWKKGAMLVDSDPLKEWAFGVAKAKAALRDCRNFGVVAPDAASAAAISKAAGIEVSPGGRVLLDGHLTDEIKDLLLGDANVMNRKLVTFVNRRHDVLTGAVDEEDEDLGKT